MAQQLRLNLMWLFVVLVAIAASNNAESAERVEYSLIAGSWSHHHNTDPDYEYNETHQSLGILRTEDRMMDTKRGPKPYAVADAVFTFKNSYRKRSVAYLRAYELCTSPDFFRVCPGVAGGLTTGYKEQTGLPVIPVAGLGARFQAGPLQIQTLHIPITDVTTAQFSIRFYTR